MDRKTKIAVVGCTGKLGCSIMKNILGRADASLAYAVARKGNQYVGQDISVLLGGQDKAITIINDILQAPDCDIFIDCTHSEAFAEVNLPKYIQLKKPIVIATTALSEQAMSEVDKLAADVPVFMSGNFSVALHDFISTLQFAVKRISTDTDIQIVEYHHNQKKDSPSGTALMIKQALVAANRNLDADNITICSVRGGNIFGEHEVIFANCKDEVITFKHQVSSREPFSAGAVDVAIWTVKQDKGFYTMDEYAGDINGNHKE